MRGTKSNVRARVLHGGSEVRTYEAPFMRKPIAERHRDLENPLAGERDPTGFPYYVVAGGTAMPCYVKSVEKKGK